MNIKRTIKYFYTDNKKVSLKISIENIFYIYVDNKEIINTLNRQEAEQIYELLYRPKI